MFKYLVRGALGGLAAKAAYGTYRHFANGGDISGLNLKKLLAR